MTDEEQTYEVACHHAEQTVDLIAKGDLDRALRESGMTTMALHQAILEKKNNAKPGEPPKEQL